MKTKLDMVKEIYHANKSHYFTQQKDSIISISAKYKDYNTINDVYRKVERGIVAPHEAIEYLSGFKSYPIFRYMY